jgi:hypothetical protein
MWEAAAAVLVAFGLIVWVLQKKSPAATVEPVIESKKVSIANRVDAIISLDKLLEYYHTAGNDGGVKAVQEAVVALFKEPSHA